MYSTSDKYKELIYSGKKCLLNIYIDGTLIDDNDIYSFKVTHNLFDGGKVSLGTTTSKSIELEINRDALPETYSNFYVESGLTIDGVDEIVPVGYFTLEEIHKDEDVVSITAVDYMMKFEKIISDEVSGTALEIIQAICNVCGVELATTDFMGNDTELSIVDPSMTARQVIGYIAELAGGFSVIGRDGKLYIKKIGDNTTTIDINLFGEYSWGEKFVCNEVDFINDNYNYEVSDTDYSSTYLDCVLDSNLYDNEIKGQALELSNNNPFIATEEQVHKIYEVIVGLELNGFNGQSLLDPALDIGDVIYIDEKPVVFQGDIEYLGYFKGNISSSIDTKEKSKTTVKKISLTEKINKKADSDKIIPIINKKGEEKKETINPKILNINGIESANGKFGVDEEGNMHCQDADIKGSAIVNGENFSVDKDGNMKCTNATIQDGHIEMVETDGFTGKNYVRLKSRDGGAGHNYSYETEILSNSITMKYSHTSSDGMITTTEEESSTEIKASGITTPGVTQTSLESKKKNFEKLQNALDIIKDIDIYKYHLKTQGEEEKKHLGFVIGDNFKYRKEITSDKNDGVDIYSFVSLCCQAIQEVDEKYNNKIEEQHKEIELLKEEIKSLKGESNG